MNIGDLLKEYQPERSFPPHEKAAAVNEIIAFLKADKKQMSYGYWLKKVGDKSYGDVMAILKRAKDLPSTYSKGGYITNQLKGKQVI